jgi:hypothetical protein
MADLLRGVTHLVPATRIVAGLPSKDPRNAASLEVERYINVSYLLPWLTLYQEHKFHLVDPIFQNHFEHFGRQVWSETYKRVSTMAERKFIETSLEFDLADGITHGERSSSGKGGSTFSFAGNEIAKYSRHLAIIDLLVPHLHAALSKVFL